MKQKPLTLLKIGGSLCRPNILLAIKEEIARLKGATRIVIIPGGGPFADTVRYSYREFKLDEDSAHWMAIAAMEQYGLLLEGLGIGCATRDLDELLHFAAPRKPQIFLPYEYMVRKDPLPHSWDVTSDSIAAHLAGILRPGLFVLLKSVDGVFHTDEAGVKTLLPEAPCALAAGTIVDSCFCGVRPGGVKTCIINGSYPERLGSIMVGEKTLGTFLR